MLDSKGLNLIHCYARSAIIIVVITILLFCCGQFDAIICDPPFGIREKLTSLPCSTSFAPMSSPVAAEATEVDSLLIDENEEGVKKQLLLSLD